MANEVTIFNNDQVDGFYSFSAQTPEEKIELYNVLNGEAKQLSEYANIEIEVSDLIVEPFTFVNDEGEIIETYKTILVTPTKDMYTTISKCIFFSIQKIVTIFGLPHWDTPVKMVYKEKSKTGSDGKPRKVPYIKLA